MRKLLRITGILFSLLIIVSVFLPYNNVNNAPLFVLDNTSEMLLPILIMAFGVISLALYLFNFYCEFPLSTSGAVLFFVIIEAVYAISNNSMGEFAIGYYMLVAGSVLLFLNTILILFTHKTESKDAIGNDNANAVSQDTYSTIQNIDYSNPVQQFEPVQPVMEQTPIQPIIEPVPVQPVVEQPIIEPTQPIIEPVPVQPVQQFDMFTTEQSVAPVQPIVEPVQPIQELNPIGEVQQPSLASNPVPEIQFEQIEEVKVPIEPLYEEQKQVSPEENPALKSLLQPAAPVNPIVDQFSQPQPNPVVQQFEQPNPVVDQFSQPQPNPVLQQFEQPGLGLNQPFISQPVQPTVPVQPEQTDNGVGMSIFNNH